MSEVFSIGKQKEINLLPYLYSPKCPEGVYSFTIEIPALAQTIIRCRDFEFAKAFALKAALEDYEVIFTGNYL